MEGRLTTSVLATSLMRRCETIGGFAAVISKGDPTAGSILVILTEKGQNQRLFERVLQADGVYSWHATGPQDLGKVQDFLKLLERRRSFDPDLWLIELDVPSVERFAAEMNSLD